jgi:hypothetical protein
LIYLLIGLIITGFILLRTMKKPKVATYLSVGQKIDSLHQVYVYYNDAVDNVTGRNTTKDGYNLGQKYQCVEFVKRYYYEHYNHKMPESYGHAKDFFDKTVADGKLNITRNLLQYTNQSKSKPMEGDLLVFDGTGYNPFGHVAIISKVTEKEIEIIQQNPGPMGQSRITLHLDYKDGKWEIKNNIILGWLRKKKQF